MSLPDPLEAEFWTQMRQFEEEQKMPYITSVERLGMQRGREEGRQEEEAANLVLRQLNRRLRQLSPTIEAQRKPTSRRAIRKPRRSLVRL